MKLFTTFFVLSVFFFSCKRDVMTPKEQEKKNKWIVTKEDLVGKWHAENCLVPIGVITPHTNITVEFTTTNEIFIWYIPPNNDTTGWSKPFATGNYNISFFDNNTSSRSDDTNKLTLNLFYDTIGTHCADVTNQIIINHYIVKTYVSDTNYNIIGYYFTIGFLNIQAPATFLNYNGFGICTSPLTDGCSRVHYEKI